MSKLKTILVLMLAIVGIGCAGSPLKEANIGEADTEEYQMVEMTKLSFGEAISIAIELPEVREIAEWGNIGASREGEIWIVSVTFWIEDERIEHPVVHINSRTGEIINVYPVSDNIRARMKEAQYPIRQVLDTFVEAYQNHNLELLKSTLWEESSYYSQIVENAKLDFARFPTINLTFTDIRISFYSDGKRAGVILQESFQAENETKKHRQETVLIEMIKTEDEWQIVSFYWPAMMRDIPESERKKGGCSYD